MSDDYSDDEKPTTTCRGCGLDFPDADMVTHDSRERWGDSHYVLTTIQTEDQGEPQTCFEVYTDGTKAQTLGFVFDEEVARILPVVLAASRLKMNPYTKPQGKP